MKTTKTSKKLGLAGFTLVEIMIVVAIIGMLAAIAIPNFIKARGTSQQNACINNLRQIDGAKQQWALETHQLSTATLLPSGTQIQPYLGRGSAGSLTTVVCPADSAPAFSHSYSIGNLTTAPICLILGTSATTPHVLN